ncbi:MAG: signal peptidase II [Gammaproteobacteria bacterium]
MSESDSTPTVSSPSIWHKLLPGATPWLLLSLILLIADQWTKHWASATLQYGRPNVVNGYLDLTLLHNTGAAFSLLANAGGWQKYFFITLSSVVSILLVVWLARLPKFGRLLLVLGLALIVSGAVGNLYDRAMLGYVVDFLHFHYNEHYWPAFNVADAAISVGVVLILIDSFVYKEEGSVPADEATSGDEAVED